LGGGLLLQRVHQSIPEVRFRAGVARMAVAAGADIVDVSAGQTSPRASRSTAASFRPCSAIGSGTKRGCRR
jgi:dihydropteroate synthase